MSDKKDNFQDYLDLLDKASAEIERERTEKSAEAKGETEATKTPKIEENAEVADAPGPEEKSAERLSDISDIVNAEDYEETAKDGGEIPSDIPTVEDVFSNSSKKKNVFTKISAWYKGLPKKKQIIIKVVAIILAVIIALGSAVGIFIKVKFDKMGKNPADDDVIYDEGEFDDIGLDFGSSSFKEALQDWATTGNENKMYSRNVVNVLLIGGDAKGNTDAMMLLSVNKKTKKLSIVSFYRDSYLYIQGKKNSYCAKLNAAYAMGGAECLVQTIENNYKIKIDDYVKVDFTSFQQVVDAMGGIKADVQQYEADYNMKKFGVALPVGEGVTLNGKQALCFCRIRHCDADSDVSRTRRQRMVIDGILDRVKGASISDLNKYIDILLPYVETGFSQTEIVSLGLKALTGKWYNYERVQMSLPDEESRTSGSGSSTGWIWVVDYQLAAYKLQMELYGQSNIVLEDNRVTLIDVYNGATYVSSSSSNSGSSQNSNSDKNSADKTPSTTVPVTNDVVVTEETTEEQNNMNNPTDNNSGEGEEESNIAEETTNGETQPVTEETDPPVTAEPTTEKSGDAQ
ncbi:MAG: LCP family protein [Acutalibacteraceae bacterium]